MTTQLDSRLIAILIALLGILYLLAFDVWRPQIAVGCMFLVMLVVIYGEVMK